MEELAGALGTSASLALRLGQIIFSSASLLFMCLDIEFFNYTSFCYLVTVMGLAISWSTTLALVDSYCVFVKSLHRRQQRIMLIITVGDWVMSFLSLAAACSAAAVTAMLLDAGGSYCPAKVCRRYQTSAAMTFLSWFLSLASALFNLWLFISL